MEKKEILMKNEEAVRDFGREMGKNLSSGSIVALTGDLGTGKTTLTKAIAEGLGVTETITSPTFNIVKQYESGRLPLYHFDVYRIGDVEETICVIGVSLLLVVLITGWQIRRATRRNPIDSLKTE